MEETPSPGFALRALRVLFIVAGGLMVVLPFGPQPRIRTPITAREDLVSEDSSAVLGSEQEGLPNEDREPGRHTEAAVERAVAGWDARVAQDLRVASCHTRLRWARPEHRPTALSLVYVHGFSSCPMDIHPTLDEAADALGANLLQIRLRGHGLSGKGLDKATANEWLEDVARARGLGRLLGKRTVLLGMSTGATLAAISAQAGAEGLAALVLLSPNFGVKNKAAAVLSWPWGVQLATLITGNARHSWVPENELRRLNWTTSYSLGVAAQMQAVVDMAQGLDLTDLTLPVLTVVSEVDNVVDLEAARATYERMGSPAKEFAVLPGSTRHELAGFAIDETTVGPLGSIIAEFVNKTVVKE